MRESAANGDRASDYRRVQLTIPARPEYISLSRLALSGLARVRPLAEDTLADLKLALTEGGLGIAIIKAIADEFELGGRAGGAGSRLRFVKLL